MFDVDRFVARSRSAAREHSGPGAVRDVLAQALSEPTAIIEALGVPARSQIQTLYSGPDVTVLNVVWGAGMSVPPHNHEMWAVIGVYSGREDNIFWRRLPDRADGKLEAAGAKALSTGDVATLGEGIIHSVLNPIGRLTGALHVYGGDFFQVQRSQWDAESLIEEPYDVEHTRQLFARANAALEDA